MIVFLCEIKSCISTQKQIKKKYSIQKKPKTTKEKNNNSNQHHLNFKTFRFLLFFYLIGIQKKYMKLYRDFKIFVLRSFVHKSEIIFFSHLIGKQIDEKQCLFLQIKFAFQYLYFYK